MSDASSGRVPGSRASHGAASSTASPPSGFDPAREEDAAFERLMDAHQTLIQLKPGDVLTAEMVADLHLIDADYRENFERAVDAFHRGYEAGLERGAGADMAKLIEERDEARDSAMIARALLKHQQPQQEKVK